MRNKSGLITRTPLNQLYPVDKIKIKHVDDRYMGILEAVERGESDDLDTECTWYQIRRTIKPYVFTYSDGNSETIMSRTKNEALKKISYKRKEIVSCYVEHLPQRKRTLAIPREARCVQ